MKAVDLLHFEAKAGSRLARFLLDHGRLMHVDINAQESVVLGRMGDCYRNAHQLSWDGLGDYAEGYASSEKVLGIPLSHAWVVTERGVVDPTWTDGLDYYGVVVPRDAAAEVMAVTETYGVLSSLWVYAARRGWDAAQDVLARIAEDA